MANYEGVARTNYFFVKDPGAFERWLAFYPDVVLFARHTKEDPYGFYAETGSLPGRKIDPDTKEEIDFFDFLQELSEHLLEGQVFVFVEAGHETLRYVSGHALAVNHKGEELAVHLSDIYRKIKEEWGIDASPAEY